jgi:hypothetical protein
MLRKKGDILENHLRRKNYKFDYLKLPSNAALKYRKTFIRNDEDRYKEFLDKVNKDTVKSGGFFRNLKIRFIH